VLTQPRIETPPYPHDEIRMDMLKNDTAADARATMVTYLVENGLYSPGIEGVV
jgi:hypothetical protein